jgi:CheY-like chemotaxis protein
MSAHDRNPEARPSDFGAQERRRFLDMISREICTPLNGVVAVAGLLARQPLSADSQAYVRTILDSSRTLLRRLEDSMDLVMGEAGALEIQVEEAHLRSVMDEIQADWQARRAGAPLMISYDGDPDLAALVDTRRLKQLFNALIEEAIVVTARGAVEASLRARRDGDTVRLEGRVRDGGPVVDAAAMARLFSADTPRAGSGLGLPLCGQIVRALGGDIHAERNAGQGLSIVFVLAARPAAQAADERRGLETGAAAHVLVVDDNATNRIVAESLCEMFDCTSESVQDGLEAVEAASSGRFDLILMDIKMPRMDGVEATLAIRALAGPPGQVPIIALTANADPEDARAYIACGMCSVVEKPIKPDRLLEAMNAAFAAVSANTATQAPAHGVRAA